MFKTLIKSIPAMLSISIPMASFASVPVEKYVEECRIGAKLMMVKCEVYDTRTSRGFLNTRTIRPTGTPYVFKQEWVEGQGFISCDNVSGKCYKYPYLATKYGSQVSPWLIIKNVSWD